MNARTKIYLGVLTAIVIITLATMFGLLAMGRDPFAVSAAKAGATAAGVWAFLGIVVSTMLTEDY